MTRMANIGLPIVAIILVGVALTIFIGSQTIPGRFQKEVHLWLTEAGVSEDEIYDCLEWSFGESYNSTPIRMWPDSWNQRHRDIFLMYNHDSLCPSIMKVGRAYLVNHMKPGEGFCFSPLEGVDEPNSYFEPAYLEQKNE